MKIFQTVFVCVCIYLFFHSSFIATVHFQILHECERPAASESKGDLVSLFVAAVTATHQWLALSVVTCLNGFETADDVSRPMSIGLSLHCFALVLANSIKTMLNYSYSKQKILALDSSHSTTDGPNSNSVLAVHNKSQSNSQSVTFNGKQNVVNRL